MTCTICIVILFVGQNPGCIGRSLLQRDKKKKKKKKKGPVKREPGKTSVSSLSHNTLVVFRPTSFATWSSRQTSLGITIEQGALISSSSTEASQAERLVCEQDPTNTYFVQCTLCFYHNYYTIYTHILLPMID